MSPATVLPPPLFLASHPALDFLNTYATPDGVAVEWIGDGASFVRWLEAAGHLGAGHGERISGRIGTAAADTLAGDARTLREQLRSALRAGETARADRALISALNDWLAEGSAFARLQAEDGLVRLTVQERADAPRQLLVPLALAAARLLTEEDLGRVRVCEGPVCSLWFLDRTKSRTRRFCSAETCCNRAKVAAFRARARRGALSAPK